MATSRYQYDPVVYGRSAPPWKQDSRQDNKKKHSYKAKTNKIPLRDQLKQAEAASLLEKNQREAQIRANRMLHERRRQEEELKAAKKKPNGILKQSNGANKSDYVTLTQDQLSTILNTLSKVQGSTGEVNLDVDDGEHLKLTIEKPDSRDSSQTISSDAQRLENILSLSKKVSAPETARKKVSAQKESRQQRNEKSTSKVVHKQRPGKQVVMNFNLSGHADADLDSSGKHSKGKKKPVTPKKQVRVHDENYEDEVYTRSTAKVVVIDDSPRADDNKDGEVSSKAEQKSVESRSDVAGHTELSPRQKQLLIPRAHMTKGEKLRLQLAIEAAAVEKLQKENAEQTRKLVSLLKEDAVKSNDTKDYRKENYSDSHSKSKTKFSKTDVGKKETSVLVEPDFIPGLGKVSTTETVANLESNSVKQPPRTGSEPPKAVVEPSKTIEPPVVPLTRAELKRLQWDRERAEAPADYDPWGRPGVGVGPGTVSSKLPDQKPKPGQTSYRKQELTSQQQQQIYLQNSSSQQQGPQSKESSSAFTNPLRGPFQEPTTGVPTSILGVENPQREILKPPAPQLKESLTKAQLLKLKWAEDKAANPEEYDPFGRPGAGAPIRTDSGTVLTSYQSRQKQMMKKPMELYEASDKTAQPANTSHMSGAMMSPPSGPDPLSTNGVPSLDLYKHEDTQSAEEGAARNHIRGQLVNLDPATLKEREEQRRKELRYQEEIRHQVEEKQRQKKEERMLKLKEEAEEEAKFRAEKNNAQQEVQQMREMNKLKEAKEVNRVDLVAEAMQRAKQEAEILKAKRRLEKLQAAGHDISHLKAAYEEKFTPRVGNVISDILTPRREGGAPSVSVADILSPRTLNSQSHHTQHTIEPSSVPGLELSPRTNTTRHTSRTDEGGGYMSNRVITPHKWHGVQKENLSPLKEFGVQTDTPFPEENQQNATKKKQASDAKKKQVRVISGPKTRKAKQASEPKPWGWKNQGGKKFTGQSKRDPRYVEQEEEKVSRAQARKEKLLKQVEANSKHYPDGKLTRNSGELAKDRETVNSYLSPRYKLTNSISPRTGYNDSVLESPRVKDNSSEPVVKKPENKKRSTINHKQTDVAKAAPTSGYELSIADTLHTSRDDEYIPFRRSDAVLSPSNAQELSPMSREATQAALAREAYYKNMQPAQYGVHMHNIKDDDQSRPAHSKDPLYNPSLLTKHPTDRQQQVLDSLRQMRQGLMAKQREIASAITPEVQTVN